MEGVLCCWEVLINFKDGDLPSYKLYYDEGYLFMKVDEFQEFRIIFEHEAY